MPLPFTPEQLREINRAVVEDFRANGGVVTQGPAAGSQPLLLTTTGARTGVERVAPLGYGRDGDSYVVVAAAAGAPKHPGWYHNLLANPTVVVEVGAERFSARTRIAEGAERDRLFALMTDRIPTLPAFQEEAGRQIPVVVLEPLPTG